MKIEDDIEVEEDMKIEEGMKIEGMTQNHMITNLKAFSSIRRVPNQNRNSFL